MKFIRLISILLGTFALNLTSCTKPDNGDEAVVENNNKSGIESFSNPKEGTVVSPEGETVTCYMYSVDSYEAALTIKSGEGQWAKLTKGETGEAGRNSIRVIFEENKTDQARVAELKVKVKEHIDTLVATFTQNPSGLSAEVEKSIFLNTYMHDRLKKEYLWKDAYNEIEVDLKTNYSDFLYTHLTKLGDVNMEDGGIAREHASNPGTRYIYSYIQEQPTATTKAATTGGLGFGPFLSSALPNNPEVIALAPSYVRQGSPAALAGMQRGDMIYKVNGSVLTTANYKNYMTSLYSSPSGSYEFEFLRFESNAANDGYDLNAYTASAAAADHTYNPILYASILGDKEGKTKIGYLVLETFDLYSHEFVVDAIQQFFDSQITDLILDLRFNVGGAMAQSRYLASSIAGRAHDNDVYIKVEYADGKTEDWTFGKGGSNDVDNLGKGPDLGLERLYVICSYNTASASELIINGLKGIDFPVYTYGSRTEGKNVGMTTTVTSYQGRNYEFAPITFYVKNGKGFGEYSSGFAPDVVVNNQNNNTQDDADNVFPYSFGNWDNMDFNIALKYAYCDIVGLDRNTMEPKSKSAQTQMSMMAPLKAGELEAKTLGRFGNIIYNY